ncbi:hypothetical protein JWJ90_13645 [Desulfobulbus rhabdoformis]|uniref:hypothetical protein n=1 Tax=Desulfobulbus rhabdoformis TaxID=34032 RepID=UPI001964C87F|nr:hypothetical protein [Desulfobulbus rhabdoformis]MBM9615323.1 hypothetical protein [Desulfobulbus rhabdoformis]
MDKGYKALVRDYPKSYKQAIAQCLEIIRGEQREKMEAERRSVSIEVVESLQPPRTFFVEGMTVLWFKKRGLAARFVVLVPSGKHQIFSTVFTFLVSKGKVKETRETLAFVRKFPANGLAVINWMEEAVNGKK